MSSRLFIRSILGLFLSLIGTSILLAATLTYDPNGNTLTQQASAATAPVILGQPTPQVVEPNGGVGFSVVVSSATPVSYQWRLNNTDIPGATRDSYYINAATAIHEGSYSVVVTNGTTPVTSAAATLYLDNNGNLLPDTWEQAAFGNLTQKPLADFDNDGVNNLDEYLEGTAAHLATSLNPRLTLAPVLGGTVTTVPNQKRYTLGQTVTLTASAVAGYGFFGWTSEPGVAVSPANLVMNSNKLVVPNFNTHGAYAWGKNTSFQTSIPASLVNAIALEAGDTHTLVLRANGTVSGWGANPSSVVSGIPVTLTTAVALATSTNHALALRANGTVAAWGGNGSNQGSGTAAWTDIVAIAAEDDHNLGLKSNGTLVAAGGNDKGELTLPPGLNTAIAIATGFEHSLALKGDGTVLVWGDNTSNQLNVPATLTDVVAISSGLYHSLALKRDGTVVAWGLNTNGQCNVPAGLNAVVAISGGAYYSMALKADGTVIAWGANTIGQSTVPSWAVPAAFIVAGTQHSLALARLEPGTPLPTFVSPPFALGVRGQPFHYRIQARNSPTSFAATGLPSGLTLNSVSGVISGTPTAGGNFQVNVSATNASGTSQKTLPITINLAVPVVTSAASLVVNAGNGFTHQVTVSNGAATYSASGLPSGLTINPATGVISGTARAQGVFAVTIQATNGEGSGTQTLTLNVKTVVGWGSNASGQSTAPTGLTNVVQVAGGESHSIALRADGTVAAWGYNANGQGTVPSGLATVVAVAAGRDHNVALRANGTVYAWGTSSGNASTVPSGLSGVVAISARESSTLALKSDGTVVGWGSNVYGQLTPPAGLNSAISVACGARHGYALKSDGTVVGWGENTYGQLTIPAGLNEVAAISAGDYHILALKRDGTVVAWGYNVNGEATVPAGLTGVTDIAAGDYHSLALKADGSLVAWGYNFSGQRVVPAGLNQVIGIGAGEAHSLAIASLEPADGRPVVLGAAHVLAVRNDPFFLRLPAKNTPTAFAASGLPAGLTLNTSTGIISGTPTQSGTYSVTVSATNAAGTTQKTLAITVNLAAPVVTSAANAVATVGNGFTYQVTASNTPTTYSATGLPPGLTINTATGLISGAALAEGVFPVSVGATNAHGTGTRTVTLEAKVVVGWGYAVDGQLNVPSGLSGVVAITGGSEHSLALRGNGTVVGWGTNSYGQLTIPAGLNSVAEIIAGESHSLALRTDGIVVAWGRTTSGQTTVPAGLSGVVAIASRGSHNLALKSDGSIVAWGSNSYAQLTIPVGLPPAVGVAAGDRHSVALLADGRVRAWGNNSSGQLNVPSGLDNVVAISAGYYHTLALRRDGTVVAWGSNSNGETAVPVGLTGVVAIAAGGYQNLVLKTDGSVVAWGSNGEGQSTVPNGLNKVAAPGGGGGHCLALSSLDPSDLKPTVISSPFAIGAREQPFHYRISAKNTPTSYSAAGLPIALSLDPTTGVISGRPMVAGSFPVTISATNAAGTALKNLVITIVPNAQLPTLVSSLSPVTGAMGTAFVYQIGVSGGATSFGASDLPPGLVVDATTGLISGSPTVSGNYQTVLWAQNMNGASSAILPISVYNTANSGLNDAFANRFALTGATNNAGGANTTATKETGEPSHAANTGGGSLWWSWTAPVSGSVTINTLNSSFNTLLGVYTGSAVNALTAIASNDNISTSVNQSSVTFNAVAGTVYQIAVDGRSNVRGTVSLQIVQTVPSGVISTSVAPANSGTTAGAGTFANGTNRTLTAFANAGYAFSHWSEGGTTVSTASAYTFAVGGDRNLVANFTAVTPPTIVTQPSNQSASVGGAITMSVVANSTPAPTFQWYKGIALLSGKTGASLTLSNLEISDAASYSVVVRNAGGLVVSNPALLTVTGMNYASWRVSVFTTAEQSNAAISGPSADPDGDGRANLLEYALSLNPKLADGADVPVVAVSGGNLTLRYSKSRTDLTYIVQTNTDLASPTGWTTTGVTQGTPDAGGNVTASVVLDGARRFIRLQVTLLP